MIIDIWSDFTCPWCYIGKLNLESALKAENIQAKFIYHSYQTVPQGFYPLDKSFSIYEIAQKSGMSKKQALKKAQMIEDMGKKAGVVLNMNAVRMTDTTNAHRILQLALKYNCQDKFMMEGYRAIFVEGEDIGNIDILKSLAVKTGIPEQEVSKLFKSDIYIDQVREDIKNTHFNKISGVPYFKFNNVDKIYGSQPIESFQKVIRKIENTSNSKDLMCSDGKCFF